ncbi:MAG: RHS repeat-associated core domain-containing protein [Saprospiraceae bacterium]
MHLEGIGQQLATPAQDYRYNGKEKDEATGLYEFGARWQDPSICRFTSIDRFADKFPWQSPYAHAGNNPIAFIDVNGDSTRVYSTEGALMGTVNDSYPNQEHFFSKTASAGFILGMNAAGIFDNNTAALYLRTSSDFYVGKNTRQDLSNLSTRGISESTEAYAIGVPDANRELRLDDISGSIPIGVGLVPCNHCRNGASVNLSVGFSQSQIGANSGLVTDVHTHGYYSVLARQRGIGVYREMDNISLAEPSFKVDYSGSTMAKEAGFRFSLLATRHRYTIHSLGLPWQNSYLPINFGQTYSYNGSFLRNVPEK